jgi:hemolysin activation/secretion protein
MSKKILISCIFCAFSQLSISQNLPSAGSQMKQVNSIPTTPSQSLSVDIQEQSTPIPVNSEVTKTFLATQLIVSGSTIFSENKLIQITGFQPNKLQSLGNLYAMADKITEYYKSKNYLLASAYLPAQEITNGVVTIQVLEGHYGKISINNTSRVNNSVAESTLSGLVGGNPIEMEPLENRLLRLSDVPGIEVRSTLIPGSSVGLTDLIVNVTPGPTINGSVDIDNAGNRYTGEERIGANMNFNNPFGIGDVASLRAVTTGSGLQYVRGAYQIPMGAGRVGIAYSHLEYELGREFKPLQASGDAKIASLFGSYPVLRSRNANTNIGLALERKNTEDNIDSIPFRTNKKVDVAIFSLYGNKKDTLGGGGFNDYLLALTTGNLDIETPAVLALDNITARSNGSFNKFAFSVSRVQRITQTLSLLGSIEGQVASKNLDISEKMELGGMDGVRAYPEGETYADEGYLLTLELRKLLPILIPGQLYASAFVDTGTVSINADQFAPGSNERTLSGGGLGMYWNYNNWASRMYYAAKLGSEDAQSAPDRSGRFWVQVIKYF